MTNKQIMDLFESITQDDFFIEIKNDEKLICELNACFKGLLQKFYKMDIDFSSMFIDSLVEAIIYLSIYRILKSRHHIEYIKALITHYYVTRLELQRKDLEKNGQEIFQEENLKELKQCAELTHNNLYKDDYVVDFIQGEENIFDYGNNTLRCPVNEFFREEKEMELLRFICKLVYCPVDF